VVAAPPLELLVLELLRAGLLELLVREPGLLGAGLVCRQHRD